MKPHPFTYHRSRSVADAIEALTAYGDDTAVLAGGQSLVPMLNMRLARPTALIDVFDLETLRYIRRDDLGLHIGANTTQWMLETATPEALAGYEVIREAVKWIGHYPIRTRGTVGGSLAHADPAAELPLLAVLLGAHVGLRGQQGDRWVTAESFFRGFMSTARTPDELVVGVRIPPLDGAATFAEHARRHGDFGIVLAGATLRTDGLVCRSARIALGGVASVPLRFPDVERQLQGADLDDETLEGAAQMVRASLDPPTDVHVTAAYRRQLAAALVRQCLHELRARATPNC